MNIVGERIPLLLRQATFRRDQKAAEDSLHIAELMLLSVRRSRMTPRWMWDRSARQVAETWYLVTSDPDKTEGCLRSLMGQEADTSAWIELTSSLRIALGAKWFDRTWDYRTRKYLVLAEESAVSSIHWSHCAAAWRNESDDHDRALSCLLKAETMAASFCELFECASTLRCYFKEYSWLKLRQWAARASEMAITSNDWLMCADLMAEVDEFETMRCLAEADEKAASCEGHILCAFKTAFLMGAGGSDSVMRSLDCAERSCRSSEDWCRLVLASYVMRHRAENVDEPIFGVANQDAFTAHYNRILQRFRAIPPQTQDWVRLVQGLRWRTSPDSTEVDFMLSAEAAAQCSHDWMDCAGAWNSLNLPDAKMNALICRQRARRKEKAVTLPL